MLNKKENILNGCYVCIYMYDYKIQIILSYNHIQMIIRSINILAFTFYATGKIYK